MAVSDPPPYHPSPTHSSRSSFLWVTAQVVHREPPHPPQTQFYCERSFLVFFFSSFSLVFLLFLALSQRTRYFGTEEKPSSVVGQLGELFVTLNRKSVSLCLVELERLGFDIRVRICWGILFILAAAICEYYTMVYLPRGVKLSPHSEDVGDETG